MTDTIRDEIDDSSAQDEAVIRDVLGGNTDAFAALERKYRKIVSFLIRKMIRNEEDVRDITQETFAKAFAALPSFRFEYPFSRWLFKIASNKCIDHLRRQRLTPVSLDAPVTTKDGGQMFVDPRDHGPTPDVQALASERSEKLQQALRTLPEKYREVIRLRHEEELDYQEIADRLGHPLGTVKAHLFRARKMLYKQLVRHEMIFDDYMRGDAEA
ncbi:MAG: sigma-70 family RNA polymerase sigma factor [Candidatus Kapabacteria bacterium]|nr:sigma-70 family RNA polymerase sigma factor [Candidatus Kapabacteria bacterium]